MISATKLEVSSCLLEEFIISVYCLIEKNNEQFYLLLDENCLKTKTGTGQRQQSWFNA